MRGFKFLFAFAAIVVLIINARLTAYRVDPSQGASWPVIAAASLLLLGLVVLRAEDWE